MRKERVTLSLDAEILRAARVAAARAGRRDSELVEAALRSYLAIGVLEEIWQAPRGPATELADDAGLALATEEQHAARRES